LNTLEKKSFYSFLALYIISSLIFTALSAYWYYTAQKNMYQSNQRYRLQHIADTISQGIIHSHMQGKELEVPHFDDVIVALINVNKEVVYGSLMEDFLPNKMEYFEIGEYSVLISYSPQTHHGIESVVVQSKALNEQLTDLKQNVLAVMLVSIILMIALAWVLSKLFIRPLHVRVKQVEDFVHDTAHELNTPVTALSMSVSRALKKKVYDEKALKNISISTKQLFDIYRSLSYLSFESKHQSSPVLDVARTLEKSVLYYKELSESKKIEISLEAEPFRFKIDEIKLSMLFGNLISNAIKYSMPESTIKIRFKDGVFTIQDEGVGIAQEKLSKIFERYNRESDYAGGFGIGLSIVQKIAKEYNITVDVSSKKDKGTCFILVFKEEGA
jgi:two-component system OmpR family sensor kinase